MPTHHDLVGFGIEEWIDGYPTLLLLLAVDGAVTRGGSGGTDRREPDVFVGQTNPPLFAEVAPLFDHTWLEEPHHRIMPGHEGPHHGLKLSFFMRASGLTILQFDYRSDIEPPTALRAFIARALEATEPWYARQRLLVASRDPTSEKGRGGRSGDHGAA